METGVDFNNTQLAFAYKNNRTLIRDYIIFGMMRYQSLVNTGIKTADFLVKKGWSLPVVIGMKPTVFPLFCGGSSLTASVSKINQLYQFGVESILDFGVEGKEKEEDYEKTAKAIREAILFASRNDGVKVVCSKFTSLIPFQILEKLHAKIDLTASEQDRFEKCKLRIEDIATLAYSHKVTLFVDAEESWIQNPLDELTLDLMRKYNTKEAIIYNTLQLYLHPRLSEFKKNIELAEKEGFIYGAKLVRGAYMEKENEYALKNKVASLVQPSKEDTDRDYDAAVKYALKHIQNAAICIATHNEKSTQKALVVADELQIPRQHPHMNFAQLLGMSDHISFNLAQSGYRVSKYMPYGPVREVLPYLIRRAQENSSVSDQMGRELQLHHKEMKRRGLL